MSAASKCRPLKSSLDRRFSVSAIALRIMGRLRQRRRICRPHAQRGVNTKTLRQAQPDHIYEDQASGKHDDRPGLAACLKALREGDVLVVWKLDRLGRDLRHLVNTVQDL